MNATDYFTYINAMFLFCIFTCGLLAWAVIRGYILKGKLTKEQDAHLKATLINTKLNKALEDEKKISDTVEKLLRQVETEVRELQAQLVNVQNTADHWIDVAERSNEKLKHIEADRIELRAERATLENQLAAAKRVRNAKGVFVRKDGTYTPKVKMEQVSVAADNWQNALDKYLSQSQKLKPLPTIGDEVVESQTVSENVNAK